MRSKEFNIINVPLSAIRPNPYQPPGRLNLSPEARRKGAESILRVGLLQYPTGRGKDGIYEIGDGWQRKTWYDELVAQGHPEYDAIPMDVQDYTDEEMADLVEETDENKQNMNDIDRAWLWKKRLADFPKITQKQFAERRGISQGEVANTIRLLDLPAAVQQMIISREISPSHGRALLALKILDDIVDFAESAKTYSWPVAELDRRIKYFLDSKQPKLEPVEEEEADRVEKQIIEPPEAEPIPPGILEQQAAEAKADADSGVGEENRERKMSVLCSDCKIRDCDHSYITEEGGIETCPNKKSGIVQVKKEPAKPTPTTKPSVAKPAAASKPRWLRKLVIEEKKDGLFVSYGKVGEVPRFEKIEGNLDEMWEGPVNEFMTRINAQWDYEQKKEGK